MVLSILQWNARSLIANGQEFKKFVSDLQDKPNLICIQETWLRPQWDFVIQGYTAIRNDRVTGIGGGVATFVRNGTGFNLINLGKEHESIVVKIWTGNDEVVIVNYYNPCKRLCLNTLDTVGGQIQDKAVWCGDFNAHSALWGGERTDANGLVMEEFIEDKGLVCVNDGRGTRYNSAKDKESAIDLTLVSAGIAGITTWEVLTKSTVGSDHYPIGIKVGVEINQEEDLNLPKWKLDKADWDTFQAKIMGRVEPLLREDVVDGDAFSKKLVAAIIQSAKETIPMSVGSKGKKSVPWWDGKCRQAVKRRNRAFRQLKKHHSLETLVHYKKSQAVVRKIIRTTKRAYWRLYCNRIGRETQLSDIWGMIRRMSGIKRNIVIPVLTSGNRSAVSNKEKAELLAETLVKVHSSENLSVSARKYRSNILAQNTGVNTRKSSTKEGLDVPFSLFELKRAISNSRQSSPGKDGICYSMLAHMDDNVLLIVLRLFNQVWDTGKIPVAWKQSVIVPILKPGKDSSDPSNYRPIALTSQLGKTMERMITERLTYLLESRDLFSPFQSGFRKGRNTMDSVLRLESEIRKAQTNREMVLAVFFDIEKAYDMLWKEGLLIKLNKLGVGAKLYNWVLDFLFGRTIEVRVGTEHSKEYRVENGTPQGSVCSPVLFIIMINDIFEQVEKGVGKSLYADDGTLWIRGRNLKYIQRKLQAAIAMVEQWANKWGFKLSVAKTQVICFSRRQKTVTLKLYGQTLEQVNEIRFLGVLFDAKLTWRQHVNKLKDKCKKVNNLLRCLSGRDWGATRASLMNIYQAIMRASLDYGCVAYMSAAESHLKKLDVEQAQGLRVCSGAFKSSPVAAIQVEMGEQPLGMRRVKLMMAYWLNLQGHNSSHPTRTILQDCWEHNKTSFRSFGWIGDIKAKQVGLSDIQYSPTVPCSVIPPWLFVIPSVDFKIQQQLREKAQQGSAGTIVQNYIDQHFADKVLVFTDGSKDPETGRTGAAVFIPQYEVAIKKRTTDHLSVYTVELLAILTALEWLEKHTKNNAIIASDSWAALTSINSIKSCRQDLVFKIHHTIYKMHNLGLTVGFVWVPAHVGVDGNEDADILAKQSLRSQTIEMNIPLSKAEGKAIVKKHMLKVWQEYWDSNDTGRHLYNIQKQVGLGRRLGRNRKEEAVITRLRIGHSGLNKALHTIGKHPTGSCAHCNNQESVQHVLLECGEYEEERKGLKAALQKVKLTFNMENLLGNTAWGVHSHLMKYLKETGLIKRI